MPTKKQPNTPKPKAAAQAAAPASPVEERAAVIAELIRGGMSYADAQAAVGEPQTAPAAATPKAVPKVNLGKDPGADEEIDPDSIPDPEENLETVEILHTPPEGYKMIEYLYELRGKMSKARVKKRYRFSCEFEHRLFDWIVYATIAEAQFRGRPDLTIEDFFEIKIKELKAADPTSGGRRDPSTSGPREAYNPATGKWN